MKKYWRDLPAFRFPQQAEACASRIKQYFGVEAKVLRKEDSGDDDLSQMVAKMIALASVIDVNDPPDADYSSIVPAPTWVVFFDTEDKEKEHLIECFIVAWGCGFEDRGTLDINRGF